ncbi:hypothetical protein HUU61_00870 [Rhodopseudomonas palustris]|nr:hypothetical protein [Rhodopseudomonas palustris]
MRLQNQDHTRGIRRALAWPALFLNADIIALGAALGLIAAVAFGAPQLRLL